MLVLDPLTCEGTWFSNGVSPFRITIPDSSGSEVVQSERTALRGDALSPSSRPAAKGWSALTYLRGRLYPPWWW